MKVRKNICNLILLMAILMVTMSGVEHFSSLAENCTFMYKASATSENVCEQKLPFESYSLSRDTAFGLVRDVISTIRSSERVQQNLKTRYLYSALILFMIYMYLFIHIFEIWSSDTYISVIRLRTIRHIHLKDGQK